MSNLFEHPKYNLILEYCSGMWTQASGGVAVWGIDAWIFGLSFAPVCVCLHGNSTPVHACQLEVSAVVSQESTDASEPMHQTTWHPLSPLCLVYVVNAGLKTSVGCVLYALLYKPN